MHFLQIKPLDGRFRRVPLPAGACVIGRDAACGVVLPEFGVSGRHAEITSAEGEVRLRDLGSTNGTFVNGRRVEEVRIAPGDRILLGTALLVLQEAISDRLYLRRGDSMAAATPPPLPPEGRVYAVVPAGELSPSMEAPDGALLRLLGEVLAAGGDPDGLTGALRAIVSFTGADRGHLLGVREGSEPVLRASSGTVGEPQIRRSLVRQALESGVAVGVERVALAGEEREEESCLCLPVAAQAGRPAGAVYLMVAPDRMDPARERAARLGPVLSVLALAIERGETRAELDRTRRALAVGARIPGERGLDSDFVAQSRAMRDALAEVERLPGPGHALLHGEQGSGRQRLARSIHSRARAAGAFVPVNAAEPEEVLRAALLGTAARPGRVELAHGGTLFLHDVADLPPDLQSAVAAIAREGRVTRADGTVVELEVAVAASTRHDPQELAASGRLVPELRDLLGPPLRMPSLRERREDVIPLAQALARRCAAQMHKKVLGLSVDACKALRDHDWKGNVGELEAVVARAVVLADDGIVDVDLLPLDIAAGRLQLKSLEGLSLAAELPWREAKATFEKAYFQEILEIHRGNISRCSRRAGIARKSFYYKIKQLGLTLTR